MSTLRDNTPAMTVYNFIYEEIINQKLSPGQGLKENSLCEILGVGRSPVRKALQQLAMDGFVVRHSDRGAFVEQFSQRQLSQLYSLRANFVEYALEQTIELYDESDFEFLEDCINRQDKAFEEHAFGDYTVAIKDFYSYIINKVDNPYLSEISSKILNRINVYLCLYDNFYGVKKLKSLAVHQKMIDYIHAGKITGVMHVHKKLSSEMVNLHDFIVKKRGI